MSKPIQVFKHGLISILRAFFPALEHKLRNCFGKDPGDNWPERIRLVQESSDNDYLPRVSNAGQIEDGVQIMHNGLKIIAGSYYGTGMIELLKLNRGVHEPQEERVFSEALNCITPGSAILELGAYWGFYSMWFCSAIPASHAFLVEPLAVNLDFGRRNFSLNSLTGHFTQAYVGRTSGNGTDQTPIISVDDFINDHKIGKLAILHSDIQGFELEMLKGSRQTLAAEKIDFVFISTHTNKLHKQCQIFLSTYGFELIASASPSQSYATDGILAMRARQAPRLKPITISQRH